MTVLFTLSSSCLAKTADFSASSSWTRTDVSIVSQVESSSWVVPSDPKALLMRTIRVRIVFNSFLATSTSFSFSRTFFFNSCSFRPESSSRFSPFFDKGRKVWSSAVASSSCFRTAPKFSSASSNSLRKLSTSSPTSLAGMAPGTSLPSWNARRSFLDKASSSSSFLIWLRNSSSDASISSSNLSILSARGRRSRSSRLADTSACWVSLNASLVSSSSSAASESTVRSTAGIDAEEVVA